MDALSEALLLLEKAQVAYGQATTTVRRLLNQALFEGLLIRDEDDLEANPTPWAAEVRRLARASQGNQTAPCAQEDGRNGHDPLSGAVGFHKANLVQSRVQRWNPDSFLEDLMEPVGRQARRRALGAIRRGAERSTSDFRGGRV